MEAEAVGDPVAVGPRELRGGGGAAARVRGEGHHDEDQPGDQQTRALHAPHGQDLALRRLLFGHPRDGEYGYFLEDILFRLKDVF